MNFPDQIHTPKIVCANYIIWSRKTVPPNASATLSARANDALNVAREEKKCPLKACRRAREGVRHPRSATRDNFDAISQNRDCAQTVRIFALFQKTPPESAIRKCHIVAVGERPRRDARDSGATNCTMGSAKRAQSRFCEMASKLSRVAILG